MGEGGLGRKGANVSNQFKLSICQLSDKYISG